MKRIQILAAMLLVILAALAVAAQLPTKQVLTLSAAKKIAAAAEAEAKRRGATVVIAVVDDGGYLLVLERLDDTQVASVDVGIAKARTAAIFRRPSEEWKSVGAGFAWSGRSARRGPDYRPWEGRWSDRRKR